MVLGGEPESLLDLHASFGEPGRDLAGPALGMADPGDRHGDQGGIAHLLAPREGRSGIDETATASVAKIFPAPDGAKIVVVGAAQTIRPQLEGLGTVNVVKLTNLR